MIADERYSRKILPDSPEWARENSSNEWQKFKRDGQSSFVPFLEGISVTIHSMIVIPSHALCKRARPTKKTLTCVVVRRAARYSLTLKKKYFFFESQTVRDEQRRKETKSWSTLGIVLVIVTVRAAFVIGNRKSKLSAPWNVNVLILQTED